MVRTMLPSLLLTAVMYAVVKAVGYYVVSLSPILLLLAQMTVGVIVYALGAWVCRLEALAEFLKTIKGVLKR